jgi:Malectin domain
MKFVISLAILITLLSASLGYEIHYAVNFGDVGIFNDSQGIEYEQEASSYIKQSYSVKLSGIGDHDQKLYQSYSYDAKTLLHYISDVKDSGRYLLVFKFFASEATRKLNLILNEKHQVVTKLSAFDEVGVNAAYDEYVYFSVCDGHLLFNNQKSAIKNNKISVKFQSASSTNILISAMILVRGDVENFPILLNRQSKDAEISQLYQQLMHSCVKEHDAEVEMIPRKNKPQKSIVEPLAGRYGLNLLLSNFTFENMNFYGAKGQAEKETEMLSENEL